MTPAEMLRQLENDSAALLAAATDLDTVVPTCPGWSVRDVLEHTGAVYAHKSAIVRGNLQAPPDLSPPESTPADLRAWFGERRSELLDALRSADPAHRVWTWFPPEQTVGFWIRRMMQETLIHRADVELATGAAADVPEHVALDGIDELLERFLCFWDEDYREAPGAGERIQVTTADKTWTVTLHPDRATLDPGSIGEVNAVVSGQTSELLLALWNRVPYDRIHTSGSPAALGALRAALAATTI